MLQLKFIAYFTFFTIILHAQKPFTGDITDKDYINRFGYTQIVKSESDEPTKGKVVKTVYNFGENGLLSEKIVQGQDNIITQYAYDEKGNMAEIVTKLATGKVLVAEKYAYDNLNRLKEAAITRVNENIKIDETVVWVDESTRHLTRTTNGKPVKILTNFDKNNRPISEVMENGNSCEWSYWGVVPVMKKDKAGETIKEIERYDFDTSNRITVLEKTHSGKMFTYNDKGMLVKTETFDENGELLAWEKYEYAQQTK